MDTKLILITGGAKAGKSNFAKKLAEAMGGGAVSFMATAEPLDPEMRKRIARHQAERPASWETLEEPLELPQALLAARHTVVLLDCLTLWVSNLLMAKRDVEAAAENLLAAHAKTSKALLVVTNEVGLGIVPDNPLARAYRELLGTANQRLAEKADKVYLLVSGIPVQIKGAL